MHFHKFLNQFVIKNGVILIQIDITHREVNMHKERPIEQMTYVK